MTRLPTVPVDVDKVSDRHLIAVNGVTAKVLRVAPPKTDGNFRCPNYHFVYVLLDPPPPDVDDLGSLDVAAGGTVDCVRYADWLASRNGGASRG